jgi:tight adherence protein C
MSASWFWYIAVGAGVTLIFFLAFLMLFRRSTVTAVRVPLETTSGDSQAELILGDMTEILAKGVPGEARDREEILPELIRAGYYSPRALAEYRAIRTVLVFAPLFAAVGAALLVEPRHIPYVAIGGVILAALGFSLPRLYVYMKGRNRCREIERGLPVFADMLSISLLAGQGLLGALRRVTDQLRRPFPQMAQELDIVVRQAELLNLNVAFEQWANRAQMEEVRNLSLMLNQCQKLGNDVTGALMEFATHLRQTSRQRADARAQRASFWMLFPTILFLWIPAAILIVAPIGFEFQARRQKAREAMPKLDLNDPNIQRHFEQQGLQNLVK